LIKKRLAIFLNRDSFSESWYRYVEGRLAELKGDDRELRSSDLPDRFVSRFIGSASRAVVLADRSSLIGLTKLYVDMARFLADQSQVSRPFDPAAILNCTALIRSEFSRTTHGVYSQYFFPANYFGESFPEALQQDVVMELEADREAYSEPSSEDAMIVEPEHTCAVDIGYDVGEFDLAREHLVDTVLPTISRVNQFLAHFDKFSQDRSKSYVEGKAEVSARLSDLQSFLENTGALRHSLEHATTPEKTNAFRAALNAPLLGAEAFVRHFAADFFELDDPTSVLLEMSWVGDATGLSNPFVFIQPQHLEKISKIQDFLTAEVILDPVKIKCGPTVHDEIIDRETFDRFGMGQDAVCCLCRHSQPEAVAMAEAKFQIDDFLRRYTLFSSALNIAESHGFREAEKFLSEFIFSPIDRL
jgi:hypothetical protein